MKTVIAGVNRSRASIVQGPVLFRRADWIFPFFYRLLTLIVFATTALRAPAMVFTENTEIGPLNTNYDGQDIVILDCTVTVDGPHNFSSLVLAANGILTHSVSPNGLLPVPITVTNESNILNGTTPDTLANSNVFSALLLTDTNGDAFTNGVDYVQFNVTNGTNGSYISTEFERTATSSIPDGATVLASYSYYGSVPAGLDLMVTGIVWVTSGCEIEADGIGYGSGFGPGAGSKSANTFFDGSGGGYGGSGGTSLSNAVGGVCYDSVYQPASLGSGGGASYAGNGGSGGGLVRITANDDVEIDGVISANGLNSTNPRAGGGSGGGIYISAPSISGVGSFSANGGSGAPVYGGGGGGGRIAIVCGTNNFTGTMTAYGAGGAHYGGAGTEFTELTGQPGLLSLNNNGHPGANSTATMNNLPDAPTSDIAISNGAVLAVSGQFLAQNVTIGTNGTLTGQQRMLLQFNANNVTIASGATMSVNGLGYPGVGGSFGVGGTYTSGGVTYGGGGGHGGYGGAAIITNAVGGVVSDSQSGPMGLGGSGGGVVNGGAGGGAIDVNLTGTLQINGLISANGSNGTGIAGGGGAGGSIYLTASTISGGGVVTANGGSGANSLGGGGGGGRVALVAKGNLFTGIVDCFGGGGANYGGAGTVILQSGTTLLQNLVLDNGGNVGPFTPIQLTPVANLSVQNGAWGTLPNGSVFGNLFVSSNSWVTVPPNAASPTTVTISTNATFQAGGGFTVNSGGQIGFGGGLGQAMTFSPYAAGGGGNAGAGGAGETNFSAGGGSGFNQITSPSEPGGNGGGYNPFSFGGIGGGALRFTVGGTLLVNGVISANGGNGSGEGGGGGAGGSLVLSAGTFAGLGAITANGGNGVDSMGGGGGGGIIDLTFNSTLFNGTMAAYGGLGANDGGAGIIYFKTNSFVNGQIIVDNGGENGGSSAIQSIPQSGVNLTLRNGGVLYSSFQSQLSFGNITITNASFVISNGYPQSIFANNIYLQSGGRISANGAGYAQNSGPGAGHVYIVFPSNPGGGGGNGGCGGMSISNSAAGGGAAYQAYTQPTQPGSGGGGNSPYSFGGSGGGVVELNVSGTLALNGTLSANGVNGAGSGGGGGAGGTLEMTIGSLTGSGLMSANGGNGANNVGGGGGGGMIAVLFQGTSSNLFIGTMSAYGGSGATNGGAGTIFIRTNTGQATLIIDNGGNRGTNTPITTSSSSYSLIVRNGGVLAVPSTASFSSMLIASNGWMVPTVTQSGQVGTISLSLLGNGIIQAGGGIIADSYGSPQNIGAGHGLNLNISPTYPCSGAGHAGDGAFSVSNLVPGGITYDSISEPNAAGSGGGAFLPFSTGGNGGGIIHISASPQGPIGQLQVNGIISANGGNGSGPGGGGGSGGTISLTANAITGTGSITANGGNGATYGGGGGGGCIYLDSLQEFRPVITNNFIGTISAYGGGGANYGGAGTLYYLTNNPLIGINKSAMLYLDNSNNVGTNTILTSAANGANVVIQNGAIGAISLSSWAPATVMVLSNSELTSLVGQTTVTGTSMSIAAGGVFSVDGGGYPAQTGTGAGSTIGGISGGGGHGGYGGGATSISGNAYDSIQAPISQGSGGANSSSGTGGAGGGALSLNFSQNFTVNGRLSANGRAGGLNAGGGAGGSIYAVQGFGIGAAVTGTGIISANGGLGQDSGGGGAGGRIALIISPLFTGQLSASGGAGGYPGGAGTVFNRASGRQTLTINNDGVAGANTPLSTALGLPSGLFELDISGGASVVPLTPLPLLSNLNISATSALTMPTAQSNLLVAVMGNAAIAGDIDVDYLGYSQMNGPGVGNSQDNEGSGGGYGGVGGASDSGAAGGKTYGSAAAPIDFGSGGGNGADTTTGGSAGGGALHLAVSGTLTVNGNVSANGDSGLQDDSGGGSGGSVWITAGTLAGAGTISAYGGDGVFYGGGGGGGGRIAIYAPINQFIGTTNVIGGAGAVPGQSGTVSLSSTFNGLLVISQSPTGLVNSTVSSLNLAFSDMLNVGTVSAADFTLTTPTGPQSNLAVTVTSPYSLQLSFPTQTLAGTYTVQVAPPLADIFGQSAAPYSGTFTVASPTISGTITGTNGAGMAGVSVQPAGLGAVTTDTNGNYSVIVPFGWTGTVTPSLASYAFSPASTSYTSINASQTNQNYLAFQNLSLALSASISANRWTLNWNGIPNVTYQVLYATDLMTWQPLGSPIPGSSGLMEYSMPVSSSPQEFFKIQAVAP